MALKPCRECKKKVSTEAATCPSCGVPNPTTVIKNKVKNKTLKKKNEIYAHCSDINCKEYSAVIIISKSVLDSRVCSCGNKLISHEYVDGKPVMPWGDGSHDFNLEIIKKAREYRMNNDRRTPKNIKDEQDNTNQETQPSVAHNNSTSKETGFGAFVDGDLDLIVSFWLYGIVGSTIIGVVTGYLSGAYDPAWGVLYVIAIIIILLGVWRSANKYTKVKIGQNKSSIWGGMAKAFCIVSALGLLKFAADLVALLEK